MNHFRICNARFLFWLCGLAIALLGMPQPAPAQFTSVLFANLTSGHAISTVNVDTHVVTDPFISGIGMGNSSGSERGDIRLRRRDVCNRVWKF